MSSSRHRELEWEAGRTVVVGVGLARLELRWGRGAPAASPLELIAVAARRAGARGGGRANQACGRAKEVRAAGTTVGKICEKRKTIQYVGVCNQCQWV